MIERILISTTDWINPEPWEKTGRFSDQEENGVKEVNVYLYGTADEAPVLLFEVKQ